MNTIDLPTYQSVVLESRAHRVIKSKLATALRDHGITMMQWSIIGLIAEAGDKSVRISDIARQLDTSLAFVTTTVNILEKKGIVSRSGHLQDSRAKLIKLSPAFVKKVVAIEADLKQKLTHEVFADIEKSDLSTYFSVVRRIAEIA